LPLPFQGYSLAVIHKESVNRTSNFCAFLFLVGGVKMSVNAETNGVVELTPSMRRGISMLSLAYGYAREVERDDWEFALEIQCLTAAGVNNSELRWLVCKGLARHAEEKPSHGGSVRVFQPGGDVTFSPRSCFVLTEAGFEAYKRFTNRQSTPPFRNGVALHRNSRHLDQ
jgi:hypothetical protein